MSRHRGLQYEVEDAFNEMDAAEGYDDYDEGSFLSFPGV